MTHTNSNTILGVVAAIGTSAGIFSTPANADLLQYSTTLLDVFFMFFLIFNHSFCRKLYQSAKSNSHLANAKN